jgi:hypothetical protein
MELSSGAVRSNGGKYWFASFYVWPVRAGQVVKFPAICPAVQVLGADNPKLASLRDFRDSKLANSFW